MLKEDGNKNGIKINRLISKKKKKKICTCSTGFCLSLPLFFTTTMPFCTAKT